LLSSLLIYCFNSFLTYLLTHSQGRTDATKKAQAEAINDKLMPLHKRLFLESNPIPVKKTLEFMGLIDGGIRPPLSPLDATHFTQIKEAMASAGIVSK